MNATTHGAHLVKLTRLGAVNTYLVREDDGFTLVDTMIAGSAEAILAAAAEHGAPIVRIALTHAHGDHIGSLDALRERLPDAEVLVGEREARLLAKDMSNDPGEPGGAGKGAYPGATTRPTRTLREGDRVGSLEVVFAPGHTPGHLAFLDTRDRTLIAGDALQTLGGVAVTSVVRPLFPFPAIATWDKPTAAATGAKLRDLRPARLAVGHGRVLEDPGAELDRAVAAAQRTGR